MIYIPTHWARCETCGWSSGSWNEARTRISGEVHSEILKPGHRVTTGPRIYTTDMDGCGVRLEPVGVDVDGLIAGRRKVFTTKGDAG